MLFSKTFSGKGVFNGQGQVPGLPGGIMPGMVDAKNNPAAPVNGIGAEPWEDVSIQIVCCTLVFLQGAQYVEYALCGNGYSPDIMRWYGNGAVELANPIPPGEFFPLPPASAVIKGPSNSVFIDMHVGDCTNNGLPFAFNYTITYRKNFF